jgi:hypothetical protein
MYDFIRTISQKNRLMMLGMRKTTHTNHDVEKQSTMWNLSPANVDSVARR